MSDDTTPERDLVDWAERCWRSLDTLHVLAYFAPEPTARYGEPGLRPRAGYFVSRSAPMGAVSPEVTVATFYVFAPGLVRHVMAGCWDTTTPTAVLAARHAGTAAALRRVLGERADGPEVAEAVTLARRVCDRLQPQGRALFAGHAGLPWPEDPILALWHAGALLREHRGDAHMAALLTDGVGPVQALVADGVRSGRREFFEATRGWSEDEWAEAEAGLTADGMLAADGTMTAAGTARFDAIETQTRAAAVPAWEELGATDAARLHELVRPLARAVAGSGDLPATLHRG